MVTPRLPATTRAPARTYGVREGVRTPPPPPPSPHPRHVRVGEVLHRLGALRQHLPWVRGNGWAVICLTLLPQSVASLPSLYLSLCLSLLPQPLAQCLAPALPHLQQHFKGEDAERYAGHGLGELLVIVVSGVSQLEPHGDRDGQNREDDDRLEPPVLGRGVCLGGAAAGGGGVLERGVCGEASAPVSRNEPPTGADRGDTPPATSPAPSCACPVYPPASPCVVPPDASLRWAPCTR